MTEEKKSNPKFKPGKNIDVGETIQIKLTSPSAKTGESKFGKWWMWNIEVDKAKVITGEGAKQTTVRDYTGPAVMFATSERMNDELEKMTGGQEQGVVVELGKEKFETPQGDSRERYTYKKIAGGEVSPSSLLPTEAMLLEDLKKLKETGYTVTEDSFAEGRTEPKYDGKISEERARELFKYL